MDDVLIAREKLGTIARDSGMSFAELVELWATDTAAQMEAASAALAAGRLPEAARLVHSASGASGICGIDALAHELQSAEKFAVEGRGADATAALASAQRRFASINGALQSGMKE